MIIAEGDRFPEIAETFFKKKLLRRTAATSAAWLKKQQERGLMALANFDVVAGMLLGMLAFEPQRARCSLGTRLRQLEGRWKVALALRAALFLRGDQAA